jgi:hypothetical protein
MNLFKSANHLESQVLSILTILLYAFRGKVIFYGLRQVGGDEIGAVGVVAVGVREVCGDV